MSLEFESIARKHFGEPNKALSSKRELRFGRNGSKSVDLDKAVWFDHETGKGGHLSALDGNRRPSNYLVKNTPPPKATNAQLRTTGLWKYVDENDIEIFEVCRLESGEIGADGKPTKTYRQRHKDASGKYIWNVEGVRQVPYRLPQLIEAITQNKTIFAVEGEKCADAMDAFGCVATCNAMGACKWPDELTPFFKGADVVILPDNDEPGAKHASLVASKLQGAAKRVRVIELPGLPPKGDVVDWIKAGGTPKQLHVLVESLGAEGKDDSAEKTSDGTAKADCAAKDGPLPLFPPLPAAEPYPVAALGRTLSRAAKAIASQVQVPSAMAAQSVLATASLAACTHADVMMPFGQARPLSEYFVTVAMSGERKSTSDNEALWPIYKREKTLREENVELLKDWRIAHSAWSAEKRKIEGVKIEFSERKILLAQLGDEPEKPLEPNLISDSPTVEGLIKNWPNSHAALGIFTTEGGSFTGGHGMNEDNRLKTGATLSAAWDGLPIKRIRAGDGVSVLPGRRLSMHLMIQPEASATFLLSDTLRDQGLLSRVLVARPDSVSGTRFYKDPQPDDVAAIKAYGARILSILEAPPRLAEGTRNELAPPAIPISADATAKWIEFYDNVEGQFNVGLSGVRDFAAKAAEHAARIAGIITIVEDLHAREIGIEAMFGAVTLIEWYLSESCRLQQGAIVDPALRRAAALLEWLQAQPDQTAGISEILQFGPNQTRIKTVADEALAILTSHNWITETSARPRTVKVVTP